MTITNDFDAPWEKAGCEKCKQGVLSATYPPPTRIGVSSDGQAFLHKCEFCGTYWEFNVREAHPIDEAEAKREFVDSFK